MENLKTVLDLVVKEKRPGAIGVDFSIGMMQMLFMI